MDACALPADRATSRAYEGVAVPMPMLPLFVPRPLICMMRSPVSSRNLQPSLPCPRNVIHQFSVPMDFVESVDPKYSLADVGWEATRKSPVISTLPPCGADGFKTTVAV